MPNWRSIRRGGSAGRTASLRGRPRLRGGGATGAAVGSGLVGFFAGLDPGAVAREGADQGTGVGVLDQRRGQLRRQAAVGKLGKGAREGGLARHLAGTLPAAQ